MKKLNIYDEYGAFNCIHAESYEWMDKDGGGNLAYHCTHPKSEDGICDEWDGEGDECPLKKKSGK